MGYESWVAGFSYGATSVLLGQPFDTMKTQMQASHGATMTETYRKIYSTEGIKGFYRGSVSLMIGGGLIRATQFGVYEYALTAIKKYQGGAMKPEERWFGFLDQQVVLAGFFGGIGRGVTEGPFEYIKVRRQVNQEWKITEVWKGSGATIFRNSFLFSSFVVYVDFTKQLFPGGLGPFLTGAISANFAWLTVWPLDVAKSQLQSGNYAGKSYFHLVKDIITTGKIFRGLLPGLTRSTVANGSSMVVYKKVEELLKSENRL